MNVDDICKRISKELNEPYDIVKNVVMHQFQFVVDVMKDEDDVRDILLNKLFRFKLKKKFQENKQGNYSPYDKDSKCRQKANPV